MSNDFFRHTFNVDVNVKPTTNPNETASTGIEPASKRREVRLSVSTAPVCAPRMIEQYSLHEVFTHIMVQSDLFIYLSTRVECLLRGKPHMYALRTYFL